jgi:uncharacterized membrane protein HdeD (DUF308 family)
MPSAVLIWVWFCAYLNFVGWTLSAVHELSPAGYAVASLGGLAALAVWRKKTAGNFPPQFYWPKYRRRFRRAFPLAFLILAAMAFLGGVLYAPTNYDALAYRLPRVLHWLAAGQWHWLHTIFVRINTRSCGMEWVSAPVLALLKTDRPLFLINFISFLLLPGLVFSVFTRLGVRRRVAWHWMWIVPSGYCFLLQAGSIGNDLFGAPFALAAVDFALRANVSRSARDFFASILAAAMMTSAKTSSLPLLLPWAVAILPSLPLIFRWPARFAGVCLLALLASALPTIVLNRHYSDDWSGGGPSRPGIGGDIVLRTGANVLLIAVQNFAPPAFPLANAWNAGVTNRLPSQLNARLHQVMAEREAAEFKLSEMQMEENAGIGCGVSALLAVSFLRVKCRRQTVTAPRTGGESVWRTALRWSSAAALLALMTQYALSAFCRILTPYYALLIPILLADAGHEPLVKKRWWRAVAAVVFLIAAGLLVVSPARPLFPAWTLTEKMHGVPARVREVYAVYHTRNDAFAPMRAALPPDLKILGMVTYDDPETSLWRPFGSRRIEHMCPEDTAQDLKARGIEYVLLRNGATDQWFGCPLDDWLKKMDAEVVEKIPLNLRASRGPLDWYLVKLN